MLIRLEIKGLGTKCHRGSEFFISKHLGISLIEIMSAVQILHFYHMVPRQMSVQKFKILGLYLGFMNQFFNSTARICQVTFRSSVFIRIAIY